MNDATNPEMRTFLEAFFSPPNRLTIDSDQRVRPWVARISQAEPLATVLPCWREGKTVDWYGLAFDDRQFRALAESLTAFIGPTYTTFRGQTAELDENDAVDRTVKGITTGRAYKFRGAPEAGSAAAVWQVLERMRKVWERRGSSERATPRPVGRVLRDFYMALRASDEGEATANLAHLREHYHLDGVNLLYLEVQLLERFRHWEELLTHQAFPDLVRLRRPTAVTEALLRAVYQRHLARYEDPTDAEGAARAFQADVLPRYRSLFASRAGLRSPDALKGFMLLAVTSVPPTLSLRDELLGEQGLSESDQAYLTRLGQLVPETAPEEEGDLLLLAGQAALASDFDRVFSLARRAVNSPRRARLLCECAVELGTLEAKALAGQAVNDLQAREREEFLRRKTNQQLWASLQDVGEPEDVEETLAPVPIDWTGWLDHLDENDGGKGSRTIARDGATEWSVADFLSRPDAIQRFTERLGGARSQAAEQVLRDCLPHLLAFFEKDPAWPNPAFRELYRSLLDILFFSTEGSRADLVVFNELFDAVLTLGVGSPDAYRELVTYAEDLWRRYASPAHLEWVVDTFELLLIHPAADDQARGRLLRTMLEGCQRFARRIGVEQRELLELLATDLGEGALVGQYLPVQAGEEEEAAGNPFAALDGKTVAVYTLTESAARQFERILLKQCPGARIALCHDRDASQRLKQLARQADVFVVATGSAKHAATSCIDANRAKDLPTLTPTGKGAASMLRAVREFLLP